MSSTAAEASARLQEAASSGALAATCRERGIDLVVQFGSSLRSPTPGDVDVAVGLRAPGDLLDAVEALAGLVPGDHLDVLVLDRAVAVARHRALIGGRVLYQACPAAFSERELWAIREYMDTAGLRRELLASLAR